MYSFHLEGRSLLIKSDEIIGKVRKVPQTCKEYRAPFIYLKKKRKFRKHTEEKVQIAQILTNGSIPLLLLMQQHLPEIQTTVCSKAVTFLPQINHL